jgi:hypothetical protein
MSKKKEIKSQILQAIKNEDLKVYILTLFDKYKEMENILKDNKISVDKKQKQLNSYFIIKKEQQFKYIKRNKNLYDKSLIYDKYLNEYIGNLPKNKKSKKLTLKSKEILEIIKLIPNFSDYTFLVLVDILSDCIPLESSDHKIKSNTVITIFLQQFKRKIILEKSNSNLSKYYKEKEFFINYLNEKKEERLKQLIGIVLHCFQKAKLIEYVNKDLVLEKSKNKKYTYICCPPDLIKIAIKFRFKQENYPSLTKPEDWLVYDTIMTNSYINNFGESKTKTLMHFNINKTKDTIVSTESLEIINNLHKNIFIINRKQLNYIISNLSIIMEKFNEVKGESMKVDINSFKNLSDFLNSMVDENILKNKRIKLSLELDYQKSLQKVCEIIHTIYIAHLFQNYELYYSVFLDSRARLYYNGYLLKPQGTVLAKSLLNFKNNKKLISLDVRASGFQIAGLLLGSEKLLKLTLLLKIDNPTPENSDLYEFLRTNFNKKHPNVIKFENGFNFKEKTLKFYKKKEQLEINPFIKDRSVMKFICIRFIYGQGAQKTITQLEEISKEIFNKLQRIVLGELIYNFIEKELFEIGVIKKICYEIVKYNAINFPERPIILYNNPRFAKTTQFYVEQKIKKLTYLDINSKKKTVSLCVDIKPYKTDEKKSSRSIVANLIHSIDSSILFRVLYKVQKKGISIYTIHDCFVIEAEFQEELQKIYIEVTTDLMKENILENFIKDNINCPKKQIELITYLNNNINNKNFILDNSAPLKKENFVFDIQQIVEK